MRQFRCDGDFDCQYDFSDEVNCQEKNMFGKTRCAHSEIPCASDGRCIPRAWICDGDVDCENGTDEGPQCEFPLFLK